VIVVDTSAWVELFRATGSPVELALTAELYRDCRRAGEPPRSLVDCLIAVPALGADATLLSADTDFERLARHTPLRLEPVVE
jgi:predicted nucleic acid-binding protein